MPEILIVASETQLRRQVREALRGVGYRLSVARNFEQAVAQLARQRHDAVIVAADGPDGQVGRRVRALRDAGGTIPLLVLCTAEQVGRAVRALRSGADDYLLTPPDAFELRARLERMLEKRDLDSRIAFYQDQLSRRSELKSVEARSPGMRTALTRVLRVAPMRSTVLINGESGVGKELVARSIHFNSPRRDRPFIALNCAAIPANLIETELFGHEKGSFTGAHSRVRGKFEIADRGTLFLDEIGEMDRRTQSKLLRVLEQREFMRVGGAQSIRVDVRVLAATNANLERMVTEGSFRRDLYYRLKVVTIRVPPLRERLEDIPPLVETFLLELSKENAVPRKSITPEAMDALLTHTWPGNVRELKNLLESVLVSVPGTTIGIEDVPFPVRTAPTGPTRIEVKPGTKLVDMERALIQTTLEHTGGNRTHSAALLGIGVRTLQRKIRAFGIEIRPTKRRPRRRNGAQT